MAASPKRFPQFGEVHDAQRLCHLTTCFFLEGRPAPIPAPWSISLDIRSVMGRKHDAFCKYVSQAPLMEPTKELFEKLGHTEHYLLVTSSEVGPSRQMTSLFEGLAG